MVNGGEKRKKKQPNVRKNVNCNDIWKPKIDMCTLNLGNIKDKPVIIYLYFLHKWCIRRRPLLILKFAISLFSYRYYYYIVLQSNAQPPPYAFTYFWGEKGLSFTEKKKCDKKLQGNKSTPLVILSIIIVTLFSY